MKKQSALLVIDAQKIYALEDSELKVKNIEKAISNINKIIDWFKKHKKPIIYIRHMHAADGSDAGKMFSYTGEEEEIGFLVKTKEVEYIDELKRVEGAHEIIKHRYSAFTNAKLEKLFKKLNINSLAIVGFMTNFCCESTARDAHDRDYYVDFILDATGCPDLEKLTQDDIKAATAETLAAGYAVLMTTEEFLKRSK